MFARLLMLILPCKNRVFMIWKTFLWNKTWHFSNYKFQSQQLFFISCKLQLSKIIKPITWRGFYETKHDIFLITIFISNANSTFSSSCKLTAIVKNHKLKIFFRSLLICDMSIYVKILLPYVLSLCMWKKWVANGEHKNLWHLLQLYRYHVRILNFSVLFSFPLIDESSSSSTSEEVTSPWEIH